MRATRVPLAVVMWLLQLIRTRTCDECDNDILSLAWRDVNASMRDAIKEYPLELAAKGVTPELTTG